MKKYFLFSIVAILFSFGSFSQSKDLPNLESLKKRVPNLKDTALVNCLNLIAYNFTIIGFGPGSPDFIRRADSVFHYANLALKEAKKINYKKGMVDALNEHASSENIKSYGLRLAQQNDSATKVAQKKYLSAAIALAENINYDDGLGISYMGWPDMGLPKQSKGDTTDYMKKSLPYFQKAGDKKKEGEACTWIAEGYFYKGYYENAIEYCQRGLILNRETVYDARTKEEQDWRYYLYQQSLSDMADLYKAGGDYASSLEYFEIATQFGIERNTGWTMENEKGEIFRLTGQNDSSFYYLRKTSNIANSWTKREIAATYIMAKQYDSALTILKQIEPGFRKTNVRGNLLPVLFYIGSAYAGKNEYNNALPYAREGISNAEYLGRRADIMTGYELLSRIHHHLGNNDSAYYYLDKYIILKDSIQNRQFLFRINNYKKAAEEQKKISQINLLNKDNQLKNQKLKQEAFVKNSLIAGMVILFLLGLFIFRSLSLKRKNEKLKLENDLKLQQLESEKKHAELQHQASELEMQALRAQMNPHFIFNCLSSINWFIIEHNTDAASDYLTRFSRLIRLVLTNSQKSLISLEDELEMLRLYLDMERLRFENSFDYTVSFTNDIVADSIPIPPLLLQPFCENAIWHGLLHKEGKRHLAIDVMLQDNILNCIITDNGIGRKRSAELNNRSAKKHKSLGLQITRERLALLNQKEDLHSFYEIEDMMDENGEAAGTKVVIKIKYKEPVEKLV
jgi:hypothetical protein